MNMPSFPLRAAETPLVETVTTVSLFRERLKNGLIASNVFAYAM